MDPELRRALDMLQERMAAQISSAVQASEGRMAGEIRASEERMFERVTGMVRASEGRTIRHMTILIEGLRSDFRVATEAIVPRRVDSLEEQAGETAQRLDRLDGRVVALEQDARARRRRPK